MITVFFENQELCKKCGGECCKNMGCHFSPADFETITYKGLKKEILKGNISIDYWHGDIDTKVNRLRHTYYLRMRNKGAKILDGSWGGQCVLWDSEKGCPLPFKERPKGARALIPGFPGRCDSKYTKEMCVMDWRLYHPVMKRLANFFSREEFMEEKHG